MGVPCSSEAPEEDVESKNQKNKEDEYDCDKEQLLERKKVECKTPILVNMASNGSNGVLKEENDRLKQEKKAVELEIQKLKREKEAWLQQEQELRKINHATKATDDKDNVIMVLKTQVEDLKYNIEELKLKNGELREEMMKRQLASNIRSKFPNVQQVVSAYEGLYTNEYTNLFAFIFKLLKKYDTKEDKNESNATDALAKKKARQQREVLMRHKAHQLLWKMLMECYFIMYQYKIEIYEQVGHILLIDNALSLKNSIDHKGLVRDKNEECTWVTDESKLSENERQKLDALKYMIGFYLQDNYETLLQTSSSISNNHSKNKSKKLQVIDELFSKYQQEMTFYNHLSEEEQEEIKELMDGYVGKACEVCWQMVLQDIILSLSPTEFDTQERVMFDEQKHRRAHGSDQNSLQIWYYVWPSIKRRDNLLNILPFVITGHHASQ